MFSPLPLGQVTEVTVTHVERPHILWLSLPPSPDTDLFLQQVEAVSMAELLHSPAPASLSAVSYSEDGLVYRAIVLHIDNTEQTALVRFIDYGNTETKKLTELFLLPSSLSSRAGLAVCVEVAGLAGSRDSASNRDRVAAKLARTGLQVLLTRKSNGDTEALMATFSYGGKTVSFEKKSDKPAAGVAVAATSLTSSQGQLLERTKKQLRSVLLSEKGGVAADQLERDYKDLVGETIPTRSLGFPTLEAFLRSLPDTCSIQWRGAALTVQGVASGQTRHVQEMVARQATKKVGAGGGRRWGGGGRRSGGGGARPMRSGYDWYGGGRDEVDPDGGYDMMGGGGGGKTRPADATLKLLLWL